jgi:membrane-bound lytic murein transglycosylase B
MRKNVCKFFLINLLAMVSISNYADTSKNLGYTTHKKYPEFLRQMEKEHKVPSSKIKEWLSDAKKKDSIIKAISRPAEGVLTWKEYRKIFLTHKRIREGKAFLKTHKLTFDRIEKEYGVSRYIITSIIGVETFYGARQGRYRVLDALSTLAFDYPKRSLFWRELKHFIVMVNENKFNVYRLKGSYAGAMGYGQFIPSSYRHYAVDGDGDGVKDVWKNPVDAIASVANYFKQHGWKTGQGITYTVDVKGNTFSSLIKKKLKPKFTVNQIKAKNVSVPAYIKGDQKASLMQFSGNEGLEYWIGLHNFYVITRYNHSRLYALAVYQLSDALK